MNHAAIARLCLAAWLLAGCSSGPAKPRLPLEARYDRQSWASVSVHQAEAECYAEINRPGGIPNLYLCMKSKGYFER